MASTATESCSGSGDTGEEDRSSGGTSSAPAAAGAPVRPAAETDAGPVAAPAAPSAATIVRGGAMSRVLAAAVARAAGLRRRQSRASGTAPAAAPTSVGPKETAEVGANGTTGDAKNEGAPDGDGAKPGGREGEENEKGSETESDSEDDEDDDKEGPKISIVGALKVAAPWIIPRTHTVRAMMAVAVMAEVARTVCGFLEPMLLGYAIDGLSPSAAGLTTTAAQVASNSTDDSATSVAAALAPEAGTKWLLRLFPKLFTPFAASRRPLLAIVAYICSDYVGLTMSYIRWLSWSRVEKELSRDIRIATFAHLHNLSLKWHLNRNSGKIMHIFNGGVTSVTDLLDLASFEFFPMLADFVLNLAALWRLGSWRFSGLAILAVGTYSAFTLVVTRIQLRLRKKSFMAEEREAGRAMDSLVNYESVKVFATEAVEVRRYGQHLRVMDSRHDRTFVANAFLHNGQSLIQTLFVAVAMVMIRGQVMDGTLSVADFVTAQTYLIRIFHPISFASYTVQHFHRALRSLRRLVDVRLLCPEVVDAPDASPLVLRPTPTCRGGRVCFDKVHFAYGADSAGALHDISFTVPAGQTTAIVGPTGSGKSTLLRLLLRLFDVSAGRITIDDQDVAHITQQSLRDAIGVVPQDCHLLRDSVRANIAYGRSGGDGVPDDAVNEAVEVAQLSDWVARLPKGLSSICGERGVLLSGGERQRVAIARMVMRKPAVVILDESSSSLDSETERAIQSALQGACAGATTLVIAHRLSTIVKADEILVLHGGRIVERGTHETLRRIDGGRYRRMWELQQGGGDHAATSGDATTDGAATPTGAPGASGAPGVDAAATADAAGSGGTQAADGDGEGKGIGEVAAGEEARKVHGGVSKDSVAATSVAVGGAAAAVPSPVATNALDRDSESSLPATIADGQTREKTEG